MKKLILSLLFLNISYLWADTQTTGSMKLIQPSTNTIDKSRSWADKLNTNLQIIDSTMTGIINGSIAVGPAVPAVSIATTTLLTMISTTGVQVNNLSNSTSTLLIPISASTNTLLTMISTTGIQVSNLSASTTSLANRTPVISGYNGGVLKGDISSLDISGSGVQSYTQTGTTAAIIFSGGSSGGSSGASSTQTITLNVGAVFLSTIGSCGFGPSSCYTTGVDSIVIIGMWADAVVPSTVAVTPGFTRVDVAFSTGGFNTQATTFRLPLLSLSTATVSASGITGSGFSGFVSTRCPVNAFETFGVQITSIPVSGFPTLGLKVHLDYWTLPGRY